MVSRSNKETSTVDTTTNEIPQEQQTPEAQIEESTGSAGNTITSDSQTKEFTVAGSPFKFDPATLTVNKGDKVVITFKNLNGTHDFTIDDLNVKTKTLQTGGQEVVEFTADETGTFEYYCSVGNHRQMGMKGTLVVK